MPAAKRAAKRQYPAARQPSIMIGQACPSFLNDGPSPVSRSDPDMPQ
jgi:hypothetical protein